MMDFLSNFLKPTSVIFCFLVIGTVFLYRDKFKLSKIFIGIGVVIYGILSFDPIAEIPLNLFEKKYKSLDISKLDSESKSQVKYIVVLSGGFSPNSQLPTSSNLSKQSLIRLVEGLVIYRSMPGTKLILTGKGWAKKSEAEAMSELAIKLGVPSEDIIIDKESHNTREHTVKLKPYLNTDKFVLVTSALHMERAMTLFERAGLSPIAAPADHLLKGEYSLFRVNHYAPDSENLNASDTWFYELMARLVQL